MGSGFDPSLLEELSELREMVRSTDARAAYWDAEQHCHAASRAYGSWFGVEPDHLIGKSFQEVLGAKSPSALPDLQGVVTGMPLRFEHMDCDPATGKKRHSQVDCVPHVSGGGVKGFTSWIVDITERKLLEDRLHNVGHERPDPAGSTGPLLSMCAWCKRIRTDRVHYQPVETFIGERLGATVTHGLCPDCEPRALDSAVLEGLARVNNELVNLQRELSRRNAALLELTRERNQLLGIAAHDLRNPIMVVQSYCELLLSSRDSQLGSQKVQFVQRVREAADSMLRLLQDTLDYSRFASSEVSLDLAPTDLSLLVGSSVLDYQPLAERKHIALSFHPGAESLPPVPLDKRKVERVVVNLLSNAVKYSREGEHVDVYVARSGPFARVSVCDAGLGIAPDELARLFQPFSTGTSRPTAGESSTGLGLAIVKKLVEAHGGRVLVNSQEHRGSRFSFELPFESPGLLRNTPESFTPTS